MGSIFEPYSSSKKSGTGLGLLIVRRIIREHGGEIEIESRNGEGTTVTISIPRQDKNVKLLKNDTAQVIDLEPSEHIS